MRNTLGAETSPYLLQHKDNPVHWQPWGAAALALAKAEDKPILLSIGYAACHWCHVMAHESFENPATAELMNELFVNIKVDREERPDIDAIYMNALHLLGQQGGWPLTMFLTPAGEPFWGGTYFPPESRWGRPGFPDVLRQIHTIYKTQGEKIAQNKTLLLDALRRMAEPDDASDEIEPSDALFAAAAERAFEHVDRLDGGLNGAPKFPQPAIFEFLWRAHLRSGRSDLADAVTVTLDRMCQGGIYDHLGGGFARYSTDAIWLVPHFEKMLYDNAELIALLTDVWRVTRSPLYATRVRETVAWLEREMIAENGAFAASLDADSEGEEGLFYVWSEAEIDRVLGHRAALFRRVYDVTAAGNWEGKTILNRRAAAAPLSASDEAMLAQARADLLAARAGRVRPGFDDKVLADWNGLMIAALAEAGATFGEPRWIERAKQAFTAIARDLGASGRLKHSFRRGQARHHGLLDDYANMSRAAIVLYEVSADPNYLAAAEAWVNIVERHYRDLDHGGYFYTADDAETLIARTRSAVDNATPSGNGVLAIVLAKLYFLTGNVVYRDRAAGILRAFGAALRRNFLAVPTLFNAFDTLTRAVQVVIVARTPEADALRAAAFAATPPGRAIMTLASTAALPPTHPAHGKTAGAGAAAAYVCVGETCSLPLVAPDALAESLRPERIRAFWRT